MLPQYTPRFTARFWAKTEAAGACLLWTGTTASGRYGFVRVHPRGMRLAHRVAWELTNGAIPDGMYVCHRCDRPLCCNPEHLFLGTQTDNMRDMLAKGRGADLRGEANPRAKLTGADIEEIRRRYDGRRGSIARLAAEYGVTLTHMSGIVQARSWRHLPEDEQRASSTASAVRTHAELLAQRSAEHEAIVAAYRAGGETCVSLARRFNRPRAAIGRILRAAGIRLGRGVAPAGTRVRGERQHLAKVTADEVRAIRRAVAAGTPLRDLAARHGVAYSTIQRIVAGQTWKHVV